MKRLYHALRPHAPQIARYLLSGGTGAFLQLASLQAMLFVWGTGSYRPITLISQAFGLVSVFLLHKYVVFQKKEKTISQTWRFMVLQGINFAAQYFMVILFVEALHLYPTVANVLAIGVTVCWNFVIYKFIVYA